MSGQSGKAVVCSTALPGPPVLATCDIRPPDEAFENTHSRLLLLADFEEEEYLCWLHMISAAKIDGLPHQLTSLLATDKSIE
jgi:hypothetical protein